MQKLAIQSLNFSRTEDGVTGYSFLCQIADKDKFKERLAGILLGKYEIPFEVAVCSDTGKVVGSLLITKAVVENSFFEFIN